MHARRHSFSRRGAWALLGLGVLLLHLALMSRLWPAPAPPGAAHTAALQVRSIAAASPAPSMAATPMGPVVPAAPIQARMSTAAAPRAVAAKPSVAQTPAAPVPLPAPAPAAPAAVTQAALPASPQGATGDATWPVYATRLPAAADLHYRVQRGDSVGRARLRWQPGDAGYLLRLDTAWPGQAARGSASQGVLDGDGVAPVRHTELQRARETRAVNFQREAGRITFSGPQFAYALRPGAQDRLSWMIQLPAIIEADATLARPGASVQIFVVGTRGDAEAWRFEVQGSEALALPAGAVTQALHLRREPTRPYDSRVEVWLDPARQHLPVRAVFTTVPGGVPMEMALADTDLESEPSGPR